MRPQVFTFTFFAVMVFVHDRWLDSQKIRGLSIRAKTSIMGLYTILFATWANTHGGFAAGIGVFLLLLGLRIVGEFLPRSRDYRVIGFLLLLGILSLAATFVNPYGIGLHLWLTRALGVPRPEVTEWHPPDLFEPEFIKIWLVLASAIIGWLTSGKRKEWDRVCVFAFVTYEMFSHQRHIPFVAILFGFWLPGHLNAALNRFLRTAELPAQLRGGIKPSPVIATALLGLALVFAIQVGKRLQQIPVSRSRYPVDAVQFMADHRLYGRVVVTGEWSQYLLGVMGARTPQDTGCRVAFDGRFRTCFPQTVLDMHFDFFHGPGGPDRRFRSPASPPVDSGRVLHYQNPDLVLLKPSETLAISTIERDGRWIVLYGDTTAQVWGRRGRYPHAEFAGKGPPEDVRSAWVPYPAAPRRLETTRNVRVTKED
jgi:hypothetical protein